MTDRDQNLPEIVTHRIPRIEVYQVTDDELRRIEDDWNQIAQDLSFALACCSFCVGIVVGLLTGEFGSTTGTVLIAAAIIFGLVAVYTGVRWWRHRNAASNVIAQIRSRRIDPETSADGD
jgi:hypothetical protein